MIIKVNEHILNIKYTNCIKIKETPIDAIYSVVVDFDETVFQGTYDQCVTELDRILELIRIEQTRTGERKSL